LKKDKSNGKKAKRHKSQSVLIQGLTLLPFVSLFFCSIVSSFLMLTGCSKPILKMPKPLPSIVKQYKNIKVWAANPDMRNTWIHINEGEAFSILATGSINIGQGLGLKYDLDIKPEDGWFLRARIGMKSIFFSALSYGYSASTHKSYNSGYLYLGIRDGPMDIYGRSLSPKAYKDNRGFFSVDVIVWKKEDYVQIADFFERMKEKVPSNKPIVDAANEANKLKEIYLKVE